MLSHAVHVLLEYSYHCCFAINVLCECSCHLLSSFDLESWHQKLSCFYLLITLVTLIVMV